MSVICWTKWLGKSEGYDKRDKVNKVDLDSKELNILSAKFQSRLGEFLHSHDNWFFHGIGKGDPLSWTINSHMQNVYAEKHF